jgi:hypothetical protein
MDSEHPLSVDDPKPGHILASEQIPQKDCSLNYNQMVGENSGEALKLGFDKLDSISIKTIIPDALNAAQPYLSYTATCLAAEGGRGATARRLLARDISLARVRLRLYQSLLNIELGNLHKNMRAEQRLKTLERVIEGQHRMMLEAMEALARLDSPAPAIQVRVHQAAMFLERGEYNGQPE